MNLEQRVQQLEQELEILKNQIQTTLLEIQDRMLTQTYPMLRTAEDRPSAPAAPSVTPPVEPQLNTPRPPLVAVSDETSDGDVKVRRVNLEELRREPTPAVQPTPVVTQAAPPPPSRPSRKAQQALSSIQPPVKGVDWTTLADLETWVQDKLIQLGAKRTRELIEMYAEQERFTRKIEKALLKFIDHQEEQHHTVMNSKQRRTRTAEMDAVAVNAAVQPTPRAEAASEDLETRNVVLRLIAGVNNASANVKWTRKNG